MIAIHSKQDASQLALGISYGVLLGFLPFGFLNVFLLFGLLLINLNIVMATLSMTLITLLTPFLDPMFNSIGLIDVM